MSEYPEHDKLRAVKDQTQAAGDFIEWLSAQGIHLGSNQELNYGSEREPILRTTFTTVFRSVEDLLAEWQGIDRNRLEQEKRAMLTAIQATAER